MFVVKISGIFIFFTSAKEYIKHIKRIIKTFR